MEGRREESGGKRLRKATGPLAWSRSCSLYRRSACPPTRRKEGKAAQEWDFPRFPGGILEQAGGGGLVRIGHLPALPLSAILVDIETWNPVATNTEREITGRESAFGTLLKADAQDRALARCGGPTPR